MGKDASASILSLIDLSGFPKYVVLRSEFSSNLVIFNIFDCIPLYMSKYFSFNIFGVWPKSNYFISLSSIVPRIFPHLFTAVMPHLW